MTISVTVLAVALMTVLMAYLAFGDDTDQDTLTTLKLVGIVSADLHSVNVHHNIKEIYLLFKGISSRSTIANGIISK